MTVLVEVRCPACGTVAEVAANAVRAFCHVCGSAPSSTFVAMVPVEPAGEA